MDQKQKTVGADENTSGVKAKNYQPGEVAPLDLSDIEAAEELDNFAEELKKALEDCGCGGSTW